MNTIIIYKDAAWIAAHIAGKSSALDSKARQVQATAKSLAIKHKQDGDFVNSIEIDERSYRSRARSGFSVRTLEVVAKDERAWSKEFGHIATANTKAKNPKAKHEWVEGLKIMQQTAQAHGGQSGGS